MDKIGIQPKSPTIWDVWKKHILKNEEFVFAMSGKDCDFSIMNSPDPEDPDPNLLGISIVANTPIMADIIRLAFLHHSSTKFRGSLMVFHNMENDRPVVMVVERNVVLDRHAEHCDNLQVPYDPDNILSELFRPMYESLVFRAQTVRNVYRKLNIIFDDTRTHQLDNLEFYNAFIHPTMEVIS